MPTNKSALERYRILDRCFSNFHRKYEIQDLIDEVNKQLLESRDVEISLRQIREDIKFMRSESGYAAPIKAIQYDGKKCYYRYTDPDFTIFNNELSVQDLGNLRSLVDVLGRFRGAFSTIWLEEVISNLEYRFGLKTNPEHLVSFEQNEQLKGLERLSNIIDATVNHQSLMIDYLTFRGKEITMVIHPYFVKQYNKRWFLYGLNDELGRLSNIALDRIQILSRSKVPFKKNKAYDFNTIFNDVVGATLPDADVKKETIGLRFSEGRYPYVVSKPIHPSQTIINKERHEIEIEVYPTRELDQQIFSFLPDVEVLYPEWYRQQIKEKIEENLKKYLSVQNDCIESS